MSVLVKNFLYQFWYLLVIGIVLLVAVLIGVQRHKNSERAAHAEQVKQQLVESNQLAQAACCKTNLRKATNSRNFKREKIAEAQAAAQKAADELKAYRTRYLGDHNSPLFNCRHGRRRKRKAK